MKKITYLLILIWISSLLSLNASAAEVPDLDRVAVALVLDNSGSMKKSDPTNNRFAASKVILNLLTDNDYMSIIAFSDDAVNTLPMTQLTGNKDNLAEASLNLMPQPAGYTDYMKALTLAEQNLDEITEPGVRKFIIFLTDGKPEIQDKTIDMTLYTAQMLEKFQSIGLKGYPIHTVGFGDIDSQILKEISLQSRGQSLQGESGTVAQSFFDILRELKNRYSLIDEVNTGEQEYQFMVDEFTSRIAILVQAQSGSDSIVLKRDDGELITPAMSNETIRLYNLNSENTTRTYTLSGNWSGRVQVVRDTKTKLWITHPSPNEQVPYDEVLTAKVSQTGAVGDNAQLEVQVKQGGSRLNIPVEIQRDSSGYSIKLGQIPQTGRYELEVSLRNKNQLIAKTTSLFEIKNTPTLYSSILEIPPQLIKGERQRITAALKRSGSTVISNLSDVEIALQIVQTENKKALILQDNGKAESGDVIKGDGIYSIWLTPDQAGPITYSLTARGVYIGEKFLIGGSNTSTEVASPGSFEIKVLDPATLENGEVSLEIQLTNQSTYRDSISVSQNNEIVAQNILVEPGATIKRIITWPTTAEITTAELVFKVGQPVTKLSQDRFKVDIQKKPETGINPTMIGLTISGVVLLASGLLIFRRKPRRAKAQLLKGELQYWEKNPEESKTIQLNGKPELTISIGKTPELAEHISSEAIPGFQFSIYPIDSQADKSVIEIRCAPPGIMKVAGEIATSVVLSPGDSFEMEEYQFQYVHNIKASSTGQNVLEGRL